MGIFVNFCAGVSGDVLPSGQVWAILINPLQNACSDKIVSDTNKMFETVGTEYVMLDSGGYQVLSKRDKAIITHDASLPLIYKPKRVNVATRHIVKSAWKFNPTPIIISSLDSPVDEETDLHEQRIEFFNNIGLNIIWFMQMCRLKEDLPPGTQIFIPVQCYNLSQFRAYEACLRGLDYNGLSLPTRNLGPAGIALFLLKFYQMGVKRVHLLSVSNFTGLALAAFFARHVFDWCSVDATTWRIQADNQSYLNPLDLRQVDVKQNSTISKDMKITCDCPWCRGRTFTGLVNTPLTDRSSILRCHNYYVIQKAGRDFYTYADDPESFGWYLRTRNIKRDKKLDQLIYSLPIIYDHRDEPIRELEKMLWKFEK